MPGTHALLSPSAAGIWTNCTPAARLMEHLPDTTNAAAEEGTLAHRLAELMMLQKLGDITKKAYTASFKEEIENSEYYSQSMHDYVSDYVAHCFEQFSDVKAGTPSAKFFVESRIDLSTYVPESFGTGDNIIVGDDTLYFNDLKYGAGVEVSAVNNKQMKIYALGIVDRFELIYDIKHIVMTIYQPRMNNISSFTITKEELLDWGMNWLKPRAEMAFKGEGEKVAGSHCRFCRLRVTCKTHADYQMDIAKHDFANADTLDLNEIADILKRADSFTSWLKAVDEYALSEALKGTKIPGFKVVAGRSQSKISDEDGVKKKLRQAGFKQDVYMTKALIGITALKKVLGKSYDTIVTPFITKTEPKPTLTEESDKRPEFNSLERSIEDFKDVVIEE